MQPFNTGRICQIQKNTYYIQYENETLRAGLKGSFYAEQKEFPAVGDYVDFLYNPQGDSVITAVRERKSVLKRPDWSHISTNMEQVMCANIDYVFIVTSLNENFNVNRIARYVAVTLQGNAVPVVLLTKADLCADPAPYIRAVEALSDKVRVHALSTLLGTGLEALDEYLQPGLTVALLGSSGVGKSTLVNALLGSERMRTGAVREKDAKGRHTTTYRQMLELENGAVIIDTPGMRQIGMCDDGEGIDETFGDIRALEQQCRFSDCRHGSEPGCAVQAAVAAGTLTPERLALYRRLHAESDKAAKMKSIAIQRKKLNRNR